jgi:hypothetical protein
MSWTTYVQAVVLAYLTWRTSVNDYRTKQINKAVNHADPSDPSLVERVRRIEKQVDVLLKIALEERKRRRRT